MERPAAGRPRHSVATTRAGWKSSLNSLGTLFAVFAVWAGLTLSASAAAPSGFMVLGPHATVRTRVLGGDTATTGSILVVLVEIYYNSTGLTPTACAFRVHYRTDGLQWVSIAAGDLGDALPGPIEGTAPNQFRDVATSSNFSNADLLPECFTMRLRVVNPSKRPYSILISDDPGSTAPLSGPSLTNNLPHTFNNAATQSIGAPPAP